MHPTRRLFAAALVGAFLLVGAAACGSSSGSDGASDETATTAAPDSGGDAGTDDTAADTSDEASSDGGGEADCEATADSGNLSGDSNVLFAADQTELMESDLTDDVTAVVAADGSAMEPGTIEIGAGEMFGIEAEGGGSIDAVIIGCAGGQTLVPGVAVGFVINEPGTYPVSLDIAGTELGAIVVS